jgi:hypothetical protein
VQYPGYVIKRGSSNAEAVRYIQKAVNVTVDGIFGPATEAAVKTVQTFWGLVVDGLVGEKTWGVCQIINGDDGSSVEPPAVPADLEDLYALVDYRRNVWDVDEPPREPVRDWSEVGGIEIHWTGAEGPKSMSFDDKKAWMLSIERYHEQNKGWTDVFYQIFCFADGTIAEGRHPLAISQSNLRSWLTVHVPGTHGMSLTEVQKEKLAAIAKVSGGDMRGHQERSATACPGPSAMSFITRYRTGQFEPEPEPTPEPPAPEPTPEPTPEPEPQPEPPAMCDECVERFAAIEAEIKSLRAELVNATDTADKASAKANSAERAIKQLREHLRNS